MLKPHLAGMFLAAACALPLRGEDAWGRLTAAKLEAVHQAVVKFQAERNPIERLGPLKEYRANLHVHSALSHDSRGTIDEIVAAAKTVGTHVVMFTEHPAAHYDFFADGHQGMKDGILLVPGAETKGLLAFPRQSIRESAEGTAQQLADLVRGAKGLTFLSHLEERMDWELRDLTGVEIYNTHADFKDEKRMLAAMRNPLWLLSTAGLFRKYPQEAFSALQHHPSDYLRRWDELCAIAPHTGVSANDAHQNVGLTVRLTEPGRARIEDGAGEKLLEVAAAEIADVVPIPADARPGSVLYQFRLDSYENSLRHVATHLLLTELSQPAVWEALEQGRAFVAFDWIADATGFQFAAISGTARYEMGSRVALAADLRLEGQSPLPARWRLIKSGKLHTQTASSVLDVRITEPGIYRVELSLDVAGEERPWILSNPLYVVREGEAPAEP
ncbi:MAG: PHP domain-containing protein [Planctomycetaceae bacterium]|nr:PHP domain-containing protein [Planctomycetaceae bacterium]